MSKKIKVVVLCGGRSGEHEVSLQSARFVSNVIPSDLYDVSVVGITKEGRWFLMDKDDFVDNADDPSKISLKKSEHEISFRPCPGKDQFYVDNKSMEVDVIFPVLHGTHGEDGTLQGLLDMMEIPYVGANYLGSAAAMDKDFSKRMFIAEGLNVGNFIVLSRWKEEFDLDEACSAVEGELKYPVFVKPAKLGSSVGINKAKDGKSLKEALVDAWKYDYKIVVEESIDGREIECAILGNDDVMVSELGEIKPKAEFYSYDAKYIDPDGAELVVGVKDIDDDLKREIQQTAIRAFEALGCEGMSRADFFLEKDTNKIFINELNTIPGFTKISMYPKLWEKSGIAGADLTDRLIKLAIEREEVVRGLKRNFF